MLVKSYLLQYIIYISSCDMHIVFYFSVAGDCCDELANKNLFWWLFKNSSS